MTSSPMIDLREGGDRDRGHVHFYVAPTARLVRSVTDHFFIGADTGYAVVVKEVDAMWLKLVLGMRWW